MAKMVSIVHFIAAKLFACLYAKLSIYLKYSLTELLFYHSES